jgi:putative peptide zinc metalloprotease protein
MEQGKIPQRRLDAGAEELSGLLDEKRRLVVLAPFDGVIVERNEELATGVWVARKEPLYWIADMSKNSVTAYVGEADLGRIALGAKARFMPDIIEMGAYDCRVAGIDRINMPFIDEPALASVHGGPIEARRDAYGLPVPESPLFRVRLEVIAPTDATSRKLSGTLRIEAEKRSLLVAGLRYVMNVAVRESGF